MVSGYLVEFKIDAGKYKAKQQAFISKDDYKVYKKSVRILRVYSDTNKLIKK